MMKSHKVFAASAVFLSAALAASLFSLEQNALKPKSTSNPMAVAIPATLTDEEVLTWNCEIPEFKPDSIMLTCADGGWLVRGIARSKWGIDGAEGAGIFREKLCEPSCAEGEIAEEKVTIKLLDLTERKGKFYLRTLKVSTASGKDFSSGRADGFEWDVMEFIEVMDWD
jgi:hypothetical protein